MPVLVFWRWDFGFTYSAEGRKRLEGTMQMASEPTLTLLASYLLKNTSLGASLKFSASPSPQKSLSLRSAKPPRSCFFHGKLDRSVEPFLKSGLSDHGTWRLSLETTTPRDNRTGRYSTSPIASRRLSATPSAGHSNAAQDCGPATRSVSDFSDLPPVLT
jgi:hypothetical protein